MLGKLAIRTLIYDRGKLLAALVGVIFSVVLVNVQGGLFIGLMSKASLLIDQGDADIWVGHRGMHNLDFAHQMPLRWLHRVRSVPNVEDTSAMRITFSEISLPEGKFESVVVVGIDLDSEIEQPYEIIEGPSDALRQPNSIVVDQCDKDKLMDPKIGELREIGGQRVRITGKCHGVLSFLVAPYIFTDHRTSALMTGVDPNTTSYFLVKIKPGADIGEVCNTLRERLPEAEVMTREEYAYESVNFWMTRTGIGLSFGAATVMGLLVGLLMVAQSLYAMILDRLHEFATLKAIGSTDRELLFVLTIQATIVAFVGIAAGVIISLAISSLFSTPRSTITIPIYLYFASAALVLVICWFSAIIPYWRVRQIDPHLALQG